MAKNKSLAKVILDEIIETNRVMKGKREDFTPKFIRSFLSEVDTPVSLGIWLRYKYKEHRQLVEKSVHPADYVCGRRFAKDLAAASLLSKYPYLKTGIDTGAVAMQKFHDAEHRCRITNNRLSLLQDTSSLASVNGGGDTVSASLGISPTTSSSMSALSAVLCLNKAAALIGRLLTPEGVDPFCYEEWLNSCGFGPGATVELKQDDAVGPNKIGADASITRELGAVMSREIFTAAFPRWASVLPPYKGTYGNVVGTVPKNAKTDRCIAIEPNLNMFFQKGIGAMIRKRLKRVGVDLDDQSANQLYSRIGSESGEWATVDFRAASDTVAWKLVEWLIPPAWFRVMELCRSQQGVIRKGDHAESFVYEKFSSMGNGFTFELESLIFWALAKSVTNEKVLVYGDDVIIRTDCVSSFVSLCDWAGFEVNSDKSFWSTPFRESCGEYHWDGHSVKPFFLREKLNDVETVFAVANGIRELGHKYYFGVSLRHTWRGLYHFLPAGIRLHAPAGVGDVGFAVPFDVATKSRRMKVKRLGGWFEGITFLALHRVPISRDFEGDDLLLYRLLVPSSQRELRNAIAPRDRTRLTVSAQTVPQWFESTEQAINYRFSTSIAADVVESAFGIRANGDHSWPDEQYVSRRIRQGSRNPDGSQVVDWTQSDPVLPTT